MVRSDLRTLAPKYGGGPPAQHDSAKRSQAAARHARRASARRPHPQRPRQVLEPRPQPRRREIAVVAAEQLVAAVARQRDRHLLARDRADQIGRDLRGIGERLVVHLRKPGMTSCASRAVTICS